MEMKNKNILFEIIGWAGSFLILLAYAMISIGKWNSEQLVYQGCNLMGSVFFIIYTVYKKTYPPAILNTIWAIIAIIALIRMFS